MVVPDANLLIYAHNDLDPLCDQAKKWWKDLVTGGERIGLSWQVILAFTRITTHHRLFPSPFTVSEVNSIVEELLSFDNVFLINPSSDHFRLFSKLLDEVGTGGNLVHDAHLAALAIENRAMLHSHDRDFQRFSGLKLHDPIRRN